MAKKKHKKKHNFQHKNAPAVVAAPVASGSSSKTTGKQNTMPNEWSEVRGDVNKTLILGGIFIALMVGLWLLFEFTAVGPNLYNSIKL